MPKKASPKKKKNFDEFFVVNLLEKLVDIIKKTLSSKVLDFSISWLKKIGHFGLIAAAAIGLLFSFIYAIRINSFYAFLFGIGWVALVFVIQYTAYKFSDAGEKLVKNNPTALSSKAFLDCFGFLSALGGIIIFIVSLINAVRGAGWETFFWGLVVFILFEFFALVAFNPQTASTDIIKEASAGQEAIGIIVFFLKGFMRLVPIIFGIGVAVGTIILFIDFIGVFGIRAQSVWASGKNTGFMIILAGLLPFFSYIIFVIYYLGIDVIRAILAIPGKLDKLKKS